ncbi:MULTISPECIES: AIPR family protein [unclassified Acinetobacter]|uniref:AIPR family protein n=1 Tax=unclassified Acinetobacter TaxID=196816 RepID=UPI0025B97750|nr:MULTISPECIES: AIPR family protein [unclassified Acinetobacter]
MSLQVKQIQKFLDENISSLIDMSDYLGKSSTDVESALYSRALAALAIKMHEDISFEIAANSITDGFNDNGIDAIYYSDLTKTLYFVQSKFHHSGKGSISDGDILKFKKGIETIINGKFDNFNEKIKKRSKEINDLLLQAQTKFHLLVIYSGKDEISSHCSETIEIFLNENNDLSEIFFFNNINLSQVHQYIRSGANQQDISTDVQLYNWNSIEEPYFSIYGQISGLDLVDWYRKFNLNLFSPNIRSFLGQTEINQSIRTTIEDEPEKFWYYNNGITVLAHDIEKKPLGGNSKESGIFECKGIKVVNGAQTVGSLASIRDNIEKLDKVKVHIRIIKTDQDLQLSSDITKANNTQNRIEKRDFVSLDPNQKRIKEELELDKIDYIYKSGETAAHVSEQTFDLTDATIALSAYQTDIQFVVQAKREISKLWDDIKKEPYTILFNKGTNSKELANAVSLLRNVDQIIEKLKISIPKEHELILVHGNRFILYCIFQKFRREIKEGSEVITLERELNELVNKLFSIITSDYKENYASTLFKNLNKCREIYNKLNQESLELSS